MVTGKAGHRMKVSASRSWPSDEASRCEPAGQGQCLHWDGEPEPSAAGDQLKYFVALVLANMEQIWELWLMMKGTKV